MPPEHQFGGEEDLHSTPPHTSSNVQVLLCLLSKYLNSPMILNLALFSFDFHQAQHSPSAPRKSKANSPLIQV
jgi:hypothetical protein